VSQLAPADGPLTNPAGNTAAPWTFLYFVALGATLIWLFGVSAAIVTASVLVNLAFLAFFLRHVAFATAAVRWAPQDLYSEAEVDLEYRPNVSIVVACHNEALVADSLVRGLKALHYPRSRLEIILVNDGSTDGTGELLTALTAGDRHMQVLHRPAGSHGGKPGALNFAADIARGEILVIFDADHIPRRNVIEQLVRHFQDPKVSAVQGRCIVRNSVESKLARSIAIDCAPPRRPRRKRGTKRRARRGSASSRPATSSPPTS